MDISEAHEILTALISTTQADFYDYWRFMDLVSDCTIFFMELISIFFMELISWNKQSEFALVNKCMIFMM